MADPNQKFESNWSLGGFIGAAIVIGIVLGPAIRRGMMESISGFWILIGGLAAVSFGIFIFERFRYWYVRSKTGVQKLLTVATIVIGAVLYIVGFYYVPIYTLGDNEKELASSTEIIQPNLSELETRVRNWLDAIEMQSRPNSLPGTEFSFRGETRSGIIFLFFVPSERKSYLNVQASVQLEDKWFDTATESQILELFTRMRVELSRAKMSYQFVRDELKVYVASSIPITPELSQADFLDAINEVESGLKLIVDTMILSIGPDN